MEQSEAITNEKYYGKCLKANHKILELLDIKDTLLNKYESLFGNVEKLADGIREIRQIEAKVRRNEKSYTKLIDTEGE